MDRNGLGPTLRAYETVTNASLTEAAMFPAMIKLSTPVSVHSRLQGLRLTVTNEIAPAGTRQAPPRWGQTKEEV